MYVPPLLAALGLVVLEHDARNNQVRAIESPLLDERAKVGAGTCALVSRAVWSLCSTHDSQ